MLDVPEDSSQGWIVKAMSEIRSRRDKAVANTTAISGYKRA